MSAGELMPTAKLVKAEFAPSPMASRRMGAAGASAVTVFGPTLWRLTVATERLTKAEARIWSSFLLRRMEGDTFTAYRLFRAVPGGALGTADGSIGVTPDIPNSELDLTGVGAYAAKQGDMISYRTAANGFWCGEIQADATAAANAVTVAVLPRPVAKHATTPAVRRVKALAEFELTTDVPDFEDMIGRALEFEAMQVLR